MNKHIQSYYPLFLLRGFLVALLGLVAIFTPALVINSFMIFLAAVILLVGVSMIVIGFKNKPISDNVLKIIEGVIYLVFGIIILKNTQESANVIITILTFLFVLGGLIQIIVSIAIRKIIQNEFLGILNGLITILLGVLIWLDFVTNSFGTVRLIGLVLLVTGIISIWQSVKIKSYNF